MFVYQHNQEIMYKLTEHLILSQYIKPLLSHDLFLLQFHQI